MMQEFTLCEQQFFLVSENTYGRDFLHCVCILLAADSNNDDSTESGSNNTVVSYE